MTARIALAVASLALFFGGCELFVRGVGADVSTPQAAGQFRFTQSFESELPHHARDPELGWRLTPGRYGQMQINEDGFRGRLAATASSDALRIAHLGDSCTMGFTIPQDPLTYVARLEAALGERGIRAETFNYGVDGYTSHQGRVLLPTVLRSLDPAYVTLYFGYNDHHWSNQSDLESDWQVPGWQLWLERSQAFRFLRRQILLVARREARLVTPKRRVDADRFEQNLRGMVAATRETGAVPLLLTTPLRPFVPLVENEVRAIVDGEERWVSQAWWVDDQLRARGVEEGAAIGSDAMREVLAEGLREHPDWPWLHWLKAQELTLQGDQAGARAARRQARRLDAERRLMGGYNQRVRRVGAALGATVVDLAALVPRKLPMFNDVVHPSAAGHAEIARALADAIERLESASPRSSAVPARR